MRVFGFKRFSKLQVELSPGINIVVGDNDAGKSTLLEVITAVLDGQYRGTSLARNLSEDLFNAENVATYIKNIRSGTQCEPPEILIEAVFGGNDQEELLALYEGDANSKGAKESGISLRITLDTDSFANEYQEFVDSRECFGIPIEYYSCSWTTFARKSIRPVGIKFNASLIGGGHAFAWANAKAVVSRIARNVLEPSDQIVISQAHRQMRSNFSANEKVQQINDKISEKVESLTRKTVTLGFEADTVSSWENGIVTKLENIPFSNVGDGTKSIITAELALSKSKDGQKDVILLEEPENHLSHTRLSMFLDDVKNRCKDIQFIELLINSDINIILCGDERQKTYRTNGSRKNKGKTLECFLQERKLIGRCPVDRNTLNGSHRCGETIIQFANKLYPTFPQTKSLAKSSSSRHSGVWLVPDSCAQAYSDKYHPVVLRDKSNIKTIDSSNILNFGKSKGRTYDDVLIYPVGSVRKWLSNHEQDLKEQTCSRFYVAVTRARYSVGIVLPDKEANQLNDIYQVWENTFE